MTRPTALVVGAGVAGLASAIALARAGWNVEVVERAPELRPVGAALGLWSNAMEGLRRLGVAERIGREAGPIRRMLLATRDGRALLDRPVADAFLATRALVQAALLDALAGVPVTFGVEAVALASADRGEALFADGTRRGADLLVAADGIRSALAGEVVGGGATYRGYAGVVALSDPVEGAGPDGLLGEWWGRHERFGVGDLGGGRRYWFHMATAPEGAAPLTLAEIAARAARWPARVRDGVAATPADRPIPWPIHARPAPARLAVGRVVCVGDAGHAMEPNLGQGACQGIEDAVALGVVAARVPPREVPALFERMRLARVRTVVRRSAEGRLGAHGPAVARAAMRAGLRVMPGVVKGRMVEAVQRWPGY